MLKYILLISMLLLGLQSTAQSSWDRSKMDSLFLSIDNNNKGMGAVSLFKDGKEIYFNTFGYANIQQKIKATKTSLYRIGSITKTFTATVIMQLVEEKSLSLTTKLSLYFPKIPHANQITIEQLLRHKSGLTDKKYLLWKYKKKHYQLNKKTQYANINYVLLAQIAEKINNKPFSEILSTRIAHPHQLRNTFYGTNNDSTKINEVFSYRKKATWQLVSPSDLSSPHGAGGIISTASDVNRFLYNLFTGVLVSKASLTAMKKTIDGYGIGMIPMQYKDKITFGHSGAIDGFQSTSAFFPDSNISITYISNGVNIPVNDILIATLNIFFEKKHSKPLIKNTALHQYSGTYYNSDNSLNISIFEKEGQLFGQAKGQAKFPLKNYQLHKYQFHQAKLKIEFLPHDKQLIVTQHGQKITLK